MTITARYASTCPACGQPIRIGQSVSWQRGQKAVHVTCPTSSAPREVLGLVAGGAKVPAGRNRRAADCDHCGDRLAIGEGTLVRCIEDSGCMVHHDESGWHVYCADTDACRARVQTTRAARAASQQRRATVVALTRRLERDGASVETAPAWTATVVPFVTTVPVMAHTASYIHIYVGETEVHYYVPGYFACDWDYPAIHRTLALTDDLRAEIVTAVEAGRTEHLIAQ